MAAALPGPAPRSTAHATPPPAGWRPHRRNHAADRSPLPTLAGFGVYYGVWRSTAAAWVCICLLQLVVGAGMAAVGAWPGAALRPALPRPAPPCLALWAVLQRARSVFRSTVASRGALAAPCALTLAPRPPCVPAPAALPMTRVYSPLERTTGFSFGYNFG